MDSDSFFSVFCSNIQVLPVTSGVIIALALAMVFLLFSAVISASEIAFYALAPSDKNEIEASDDPVDKKISKLLDNPEYLLATMLIWHNFFTVLVIVLCTFVFNQIIDFTQAPGWGFAVETVILTLLLLLFSEIIPKVYAQNNALNFIRRISPVITMLGRFIHPLAALLVRSENIFNKSRKKKKKDVSVHELSKALELTSDKIPEEKEMLEGIIKLYNKTAVEIMTSRLDVADIDIKTTFSEVIKNIIEVGYSRIPVYSTSKDDIKGILYIKDLLPYIDKPDSFRWQSLIRPAFFVPETKKIDDLLEEFRTNKIHLAVVVDEFGGTSGIVTLEDILEEIVGEISDEYDDDDDAKFIKLADGSYIFDAKILLSDFFRVTGLDHKLFGKLTEDVDTLAGLILEIKRDFPEKKEVVRYDQYAFRILEIDNRRILKIKFYIDKPVPKTQGVDEE